MRRLAPISLVALGISIAAAQPCLAQSSSVAKQSAPERLAPPETEPEQDAVTLPQQLHAPNPLPTVVVPQPVYAKPSGRPGSHEPGENAAPQQQQSAFSTPERLLEWVSNYRSHPNPSRVPAAVHAMKDFGLFGDEEKQWFCIGFIAGVLGANPKDGPALVAGMFPMPDKEQAVIIRAIAYSGRPDWKQLLEKYSSRMPLRRPLIDDFLQGKRPTLMHLPLDSGGTPGIYALWGYYVATGQHEPVVRIMQALRWSKNKDDPGFSWKKVFSGWGKDATNVDKVTTGGTAKWTLASYGERDRDLLDLYRAEASRQPEDISKPLNDVIKAAEDFESENIRKDQFGAIQDVQRAQMAADAGMSKGASLGSIAIATGCVAASALGQAELALPCVIGGALYTGAAKLAH